MELYYTGKSDATDKSRRMILLITYPYHSPSFCKGGMAGGYEDLNRDLDGDLNTRRIGVL